MKGFTEIIAGIDFNRDDDKKEFGATERIVSINCFEEDGQEKIGLSFSLGRKENDTIYLVFDCEEFFSKGIEAVINK